MEKFETIISKTIYFNCPKQITISLKYLNMLYASIKLNSNIDEFDEYTNTFLDLLDYFVDNQIQINKIQANKTTNTRNNLIDQFLEYMSNMKKSTKNDYIKRISTICHEENIKVDQLAENIDYYIERYSTGEKRERGSDSHNSYRCALKKFGSFIQDLNSLNQSFNLKEIEK